jgi:hypothetical protein
MKKEEIFIITDGKKYIKEDINGRYKSVNNLTLADTFPNFKCANNVLKNSLTPALKLTFYVAKIEDGEVVANTPTIAKASKTFLRKDSGEYAYTVKSHNIDSWLDKIDDLDTLFLDAERRKGEIATELSKIEAEKIDIEHYIEFKAQNACQGFKLYKRLRQVLVKRRQLVNEQKIISIINATRDANRELEKMVKKIKGLDNQVYKPRLLVDLFDKDDI